MQSKLNWALLADQILGAAKPLGLQQFGSVVKVHAFKTVSC